MKPTAKQYRKAAIRLHYEGGALEIDPGAPVSKSPDEHGAYVQAWLWITDTEARKERYNAPRTKK